MGVNLGFLKAIAFSQIYAMSKIQSVASNFVQDARGSLET